MALTQHVAETTASAEEIQKGWHELVLRVGQLEAERSALEQENKSLRALIERVIEHRQKSHSELILLLTSLVSKLPINDVGIIVSRLVEHNTHVGDFLSAIGKGAADGELPKPAVLKTLEDTRRDLAAALKPVIDELIRLDSPIEKELLQALPSNPELFFSPRFIRANRCFIKGQVARERIAKEYGEKALIFFNDLTTDTRLNPNPKRDEIVLGFKSDFETLLQQQGSIIPEKSQALLSLYHCVQRSKASTDQARAQRSAFQKLSFLVELLHFYDHQNTEAPDVIFAQRLPALIEQLALSGPQEPLDEKLINQAESLLAFVISPDHRQMIINNIGKGGGTGGTLKYVFRLRAERVLEADQTITDFVRHLIPPSRQKPPAPEEVTAILRLLSPEMQRVVVRGIMSSDRMRKEQAEALGRAIGERLGLKALDEPLKSELALPAEMERQLAWGRIKDLIAQRTDAGTVAAAIRERLNARYDAEEIRQSWITLTEADAISLIRIICHLPYLANGKTDPIARTVIDTYVTRLTHEKYTTTYHKVVNSLRGMFHVKPDSPTLLTFLALIRWVSPEAANKLSRDIGMPLPAQ